MSEWPDEPEPPFDFFTWLSAQAEEAMGGMMDWENSDQALHGAVEEYLRWRSEEPPTYPCIGAMPAEVAIGLQHLMRKYGHHGLRSAAEIHEQLAIESRTRAMREHQSMFG